MIAYGTATYSWHQGGFDRWAMVRIRDIDDQLIATWYVDEIIVDYPEHIGAPAYYGRVAVVP
jgi:hypothetical protein